MSHLNLESAQDSHIQSPPEIKYICSDLGRKVLSFGPKRKMLTSVPIFLPPVLQLLLTGLTDGKGSVYIAVFDRKEAFLQTDQARVKKIVPILQSGALEVLLPDLLPGTYAISCFHDLNGNGKLDKNFLGIPSEPYGFSNNARPKFRAPNWEEARFEWKGDTRQISIKLEKW